MSRYSVVVLLEDIQVDEHLKYLEMWILILERNMNTLPNKMMGLVKAQYQHWKGSSSIVRVLSGLGIMSSLYARTTLSYLWK